MSSRRTIAARLLLDEDELERRPLDDVKADLEALGIDPRPAIERVMTQAEALCRDINPDAAHDSKQTRVSPAGRDPEEQTRDTGSRRRWAGPLDWLGFAEWGLAPRAASVAALVLASGVGGWMLSDRYGQPEPAAPAFTFSQQAHNTHARYASDAQHPVEFGADQQDRVLLWLSERLGQSVEAPDLADLGFTLVGGRLLPAAGEATAELMYENQDARRITLYIRSGSPSPRGAADEDTINFTDQGGTRAVYWMEGPLAYALGGELDREQLLAIAKIVQRQRAEPGLPAPEQSATTRKGPD
jgi:anti-sigma factor RsiW